MLRDEVVYPSATAQPFQKQLAKWDILCQPKEQGGLGIQNLELKNIVLLSKWLYRLLTTDDTLQQVLRNKVPRN